MREHDRATVVVVVIAILVDRMMPAFADRHAEEANEMGREQQSDRETEYLDDVTKAKHE